MPPDLGLGTKFLLNLDAYWDQLTMVFLSRQTNIIEFETFQNGVVRVRGGWCDGDRRGKGEGSRVSRLLMKQEQEQVADEARAGKKQL